VSFHERIQEAMSADVSPTRAEARRLGDAMRRVIEVLVATEAPAESLAAAADSLEAVASSLESYPTHKGWSGFAETANAGDTHGHFDSSPVIGRANPLAPPVDVEVRDGKVEGRVVFGSAYEGPPGCVHGGYIAAAFDEVLGMTQSISGHPGMTGTLTVRYRRPTPLHTELRFEGVLLGVEGRKIRTEGRVYANGELTAEAEAIFISVDFSKMAEMAQRRDEGAS
jgi:acyl-coenzyme A thioesterase PaaI-like protein